MMTFKELRQIVLEANLELVAKGLVIATWGNVSGFDSNAGVVAIKPGGVEYNQMKEQDIVLVDLDGNKVEGSLNPSSDTPTHLELYRNFPKLGGIAHTHSVFATAFAQAQRPIPCLGTTHADHFHGQVQVTREMKKNETQHEYELNTGRLIVETFLNSKHLECPAVLVAGHGPFTWGETPQDAVANSAALETVAQMAMATLTLSPEQPELPPHLQKKHFLRKHGPNAYYGQSKLNK